MNDADDGKAYRINCQRTCSCGRVQHSDAQRVERLATVAYGRVRAATLISVGWDACSASCSLVRLHGTGSSEPGGRTGLIRSRG